MINPYVTGFPADPKSFAGRERDLGEIKKAIDYTVHSEPATPQNVAIVGDWGIGKTSLLNKSKTIALDKDCFVCKITLTPEKCKNMDSFVYNTIDELHTAIWEFSHLAAARFIEDLTIASEKEKEVLFKMAKLEEEADIKEIEAPNVSVHLKRLVEKNLVVRIDRGRYKFYHPLFREFLEKMK